MDDKIKYVVGVDLGGTKIYAAVIDKKGKIYGSARVKTRAEEGFNAVIDRLFDCIMQAVNNSKITLAEIGAVGLGSPGPLDLEEGKIIETPNLGWKDAPLKARLEKTIKKPVRVDNDGNVGLLGEYAYGAGHGAKHMVGLFIGTGVGGGVIIDGKLLHGFNENAGELGHMILDPNGPRCGCGNHGCLEAFSGRLAIEKQIRIAEINGVPTKIFKKMKKKSDKIRSGILAKGYLEKDPAVTAAIERSATYVGYGVASLLNIFNPEVVVLGGGVVEAIGGEYVKIVRKVAIENAFAIASRNVRIIAAELKDDSAILGASFLAWQAIEDLNHSNIL
ncbi:ROK family protein [candidate division KSB1 bacterium]|nr:ROK family protein [candidate division KSB1 bacterium]